MSLSEHDIFHTAKDTLISEGNSVLSLVNQIDRNFYNAIVEIINSSGRVVITGIGKSAIIGQKIVATLNSTGTPALFMHAAEAIHGDLGMIQRNDIIICISKSGSSPEIKTLIPLLKRSTNKIIGFVGDNNSFLAKNCHFPINTYVEKEACPNNLAPTNSTTAQLAMGDALAICLLKFKKFTPSDFANYHPGGALGKQLYLTLNEMAQQNAKPFVSQNTDLKSCIIRITDDRMGAAVVCNDKNYPIGIITDGDLRRALLDGINLETTQAQDIMTKNPIVIESNKLAIEGLELLKSKKINHLILINENGYTGLIHIQDFIREGLI
jgi:arabinose-5-phosphate isomerase